MNVVISWSPYTHRDLEIVFPDEDVVFVNSTNMTDLVCELGLYKSKSQARDAGRLGDIPTGYNQIKGNKKTTLYIWNPSE